MFTPADSPSLFAFLLIVVSVVATVIFGTLKAGPEKKAAKARAIRLFLGICLWCGILGALVTSGWVEAQPMPRLMILFGLCNLMGVLFGLSPIGRDLATNLPLYYLVAFQAFRLPLEFVLHAWANQGVIPQTMTWTGQNFDIATGAMALILAPFASKNHSIAWFVNIVGFILLLNVMRVAILSSPLPFAWGVTPPLQLGFHVPYFLIVPICVAGALAGHIVLTRALLRKKS